jgi:membrane-associated phospholipid phosphatase
LIVKILSISAAVGSGHCTSAVEDTGPWAAHFRFYAAVVLALLAFALALASKVHAEEARDGPFEIDHRLKTSDEGFWSRRVQLGLQVGMIASVTTLALYEGSESRLGRTAWQAIDSMIITAGATQAAKIAFSRSRPNATDDAGKFFQGSRNRSFPSGEVSNVAAILTPFVLEYGAESPWLVAGAGALVVYDGVARMKVRGHWQSDVIAGAGLGLSIGYLMHQRSQPLVLLPLPRGIFLGFSRQF